MRLFVACLLVSACVTTGATRTPAERVAGCWIDRAGATTTTMRWLPDQSSPGGLAGSRLVYGPNGVTGRARYTLRQADGAWTLCELGGAGEAPACRQVAEGSEGSLAGGRAFIDLYGERLRITVAGDEPERTIFSGARDGCD